MNTDHPAMRYHLEVINEGRLALLHELLTPDFVNLATGFPAIEGVEAMVRAVGSILEGFPGCRSTVHTMLDEGERCALRWEISGRHEGPFQGIPPTGRAVTLGGIHIDHLREGRIAKRWAYNNFPLLLAELRAAAKG